MDGYVIGVAIIVGLALVIAFIGKYLIDKYN